VAGDDCPGVDAVSEHIKWYPRVAVAKYSIEQTRWAAGILERQLGWMRSMHTSTGFEVRYLHGDLLADLFPFGPEDGFAFDEGNQMTSAGLTNLITLLTGGAASGGAGWPLSLGAGGGASGSAGVGVGTDGATAFSVAQTHLANASGEGSANSWYQSMDTGYPTLTLPSVINGQSTFQAGAANFVWDEWCWFSGAGVPTAGPVLGSVYAVAGSGSMLNRKIPSGGLGTKASGAAWVFQTNVTFS